MPPLLYQILHLGGAFLFVAAVFCAFQNPTEEQRPRLHMAMGMLSLVTLLGGFGLLAKFGYGFPGWVILKLGCWLGLAAVASIAMRRPEKAKPLRVVAGLLVVTAVYAVYGRPF